METNTDGRFDAACGCVGYGYVPTQQLGTVTDADTAIANGTLFPELALALDEYGTVCKGSGGEGDE